MINVNNIDTDDVSEICPIEKDLDKVRTSIKEFFNDDNSRHHSDILKLRCATNGAVSDCIYDLAYYSDLNISFLNTIIIEDLEDTAKLCDYFEVTLRDSSRQPMIFFLETTEVATAISLIQTEEETIVGIEPLEESPKFLRNKWEKMLDEYGVHAGMIDKKKVFKTSK